MRAVGGRARAKRLVFEKTTHGQVFRKEPKVPLHAGARSGVPSAHGRRYPVAELPRRRGAIAGVASGPRRLDGSGRGGGRQARLVGMPSYPFDHDLIVEPKRLVGESET